MTDPPDPHIPYPFPPLREPPERQGPLMVPIVYEPTGDPVVVAPRETGLEYYLVEGGEIFFILTNADGARDYTLTLPAPIPVKTFWAIDIYDTQTRSLLQTDNPYPSVNNRFTDLQTEDNGDTIIRFGPTAGTQPNGLQTVPGKSWFPILRLYGPLESWFDQTWRPGEIQPS